MDPTILSRARDRLFAMHVQADTELAERRTEIYQNIPRIADIDAELGSTAAKIMIAATTEGSDPKPKLEALKARNVEAQAERVLLLEKGGYPADALEPHYQCKQCGDTGYLKDGSMCDCLVRLYADEQISELETRLPVRKATFEKFDPSVYPDEPFEGKGDSPRDNALAARQFCHSFAADPAPDHSLLIFGGAGVGKTFLASATAVEASRRGKSVLCRSMTELVSLYEREKFTYDDDTRDVAQAEIDRLGDCDLLIIDDLGLEFKSAFSTVVLTNILITRVERGKPVLICTGLDRDELETRYSEQVASRLLGDEFYAFSLFGPDLRRSK